PNLLGSLGLYERAHGEEDRARKFLEAAYAAKTTRTDALLELARYRYADAMAKPEAASSRFSGAQVSSVMLPLRMARKQPPPIATVYELAGDTLLRSDVKLGRDDAVIVIEGAQLFPTRLKLVFQAAVMASELGELQSAHALADHGIRYAPDGTAKKRFEDLKASLPPAPPPPPEPAAKSPPAPAKKK
ncbi:MAG: hypothetical protein ACREF9_11625, partial [Opitutaceae bacterium]